MSDFWTALTQLLHTSTVIIDRAQGTPHPRYPLAIYPLDYGYLAGTTAADGEGIDVWIGSLAGEYVLSGAIVVVDVLKRETEIKLLLNCSATDCQQIVQFMQDHFSLGCYLLTP